MKEIDFLLTHVKEWSRKFPEIHIKYAYEHSTEFHIIEVDPSTALDNNQEFRLMVRNTWRSFIQLFPGVELLVDRKSDAHTMTDVKYDSDDRQTNGNEYSCTYNGNDLVFKFLRPVSGGAAWRKVDSSYHTSNKSEQATSTDLAYALAA